MRIDLHTDPVIRAVTGGRREPRPWLRLVSATLTLAGEHAQLLSHSETAWASGVFSGARHTIRLRFEGDAVSQADPFITALPEHEFALSGKLVADATISAVEHRLTPQPEVVIEVELLVIDDG